MFARYTRSIRRISFSSSDNGGDGVLIEQPRFRFRQMPIGKAEHGDRLFAAERPAQSKLVADAELPMRLAALAVDLDFSALTRLLRLGARAIQARDVEPDVEANGGIRLEAYAIRWSTMECYQQQPQVSQTASVLSC